MLTMMMMLMMMMMMMIMLMLMMMMMPEPGVLTGSPTPCWSSSAWAGTALTRGWPGCWEAAPA